MESRRRQIVAIVLIFFLMIATVPIIGTQSSFPKAVLTDVIFDRGVDTDDDGTFDYLEVGVQVNVTEAGSYRVSLSGLLDSNLSYIDVYGSSSMFLDTGLRVVNVSLEGPRIHLSRRNPRYISYVRLWSERYDNGKYILDFLDSRWQVPLSKEYYFTQFDPPRAILTGLIYDRGVDTDDDGAYNYLEIGVEINVTEQGICSASISGLRDTDGNWISVWGSESGYLDVGLRLLNVSLSGYMIRSSRLNPRYVNYISLQADYHSSIYDVPLSKEYLYTEFDFPAILTGAIFDQGVDTDADGSFDYLEVGVQVNVSDPGTYVLYLSGLRDAISGYISVRDSKTIYLSAGIQTVNLYLYGPQIYVTRRNPTTVSYISLREKRYMDYYPYYDSLGNVPLSRQYLYTEFDAPFVDVETRFVVYPDGRVAVEGALNYTNMVPENTPRYTTAQGFFNLTGDELSSQASAGLTLNLPTEVASQFPYNSTTAELLAKYSNGLLDLGINSTMVLPPVLASQYPYNSTDGTLKATYSGGILNIQVEGNTTLPSSVTSQFPFNATDLTIVGNYSENELYGRITFDILPDFMFDDVNVGFKGNQTDLTLNGTVHIVFNVPLGDFVIHNETELIQIIDQLKSDLLGEEGMVWNMTGGLLNVTNLDIDYVLNGIGASVTFKMDVHGDFVRALAYVMSGGRNEMLLYPVLNEAYQSVQSGSFDIRYSRTTLEASMRLTFSYDLKRLMDYILTPPTGTTPYVIASYSMSPTLWVGDVVMIEEVSNASDIVADPETGDIIAFYSPYDPRYIVIHRAINKTYANGTLYFTTKGDANWSPDSWSVPESLVIGKAVRRIPLLGYLVSYPYFSYPYYYYPYPQSTAAARLSLLKAVHNSVENMSIQLSYSSIDKRFDFRLTQMDKLKTLMEESALILPEILPPETPPEIRTFVESLLNTTYASVDSANVSFMYESGKADFEATATIEGDLSAEVNYVKDLYFQLLGAQYSRYNLAVPWQLDFINQTKVDISNFGISAKLGETSFEGKIEGLTLMPPTDALNATHFKLERFFNLTAPQYPWQREFPGQNQRLKITVEGGSNVTHSVRLFRPPTVPEPELTTPDGKSMVWFNQTVSGLKDLVFEIQDNSYAEVSTDKPEYSRGENVTLIGAYMFLGEEVENATVLFQVNYPNGTLYFVGLAETNASGMATLEFSLYPDDPVGNYDVYATFYKSGLENATATTSFMITIYEPNLQVWFEGPDMTLISQNATMILHVANVGNATAYNANATLTLPSDITVIEANTSYMGTIDVGEEIILQAIVSAYEPNRFVFLANATYTMADGTPMPSVSDQKVLVYAYHFDYPVDLIDMTTTVNADGNIEVNLTAVNYGPSAVQITLIASAQHTDTNLMLVSAYQTVSIDPGETITITLVIGVPEMAPSGDYAIQGVLATGLPHQGGFALTFKEQTLIVV